VIAHAIANWDALMQKVFGPSPPKKVSVPTPKLFSEHDGDALIMWIEDGRPAWHKPVS
jgi:hypothetical protein